MENAHRAELTSLEYKREQDVRALESNLVSQHRSLEFQFLVGAIAFIYGTRR